MANKNKKKGNGSILHSVISQRIVESHDWRFQCDSTQKKDQILKSPHFHDDYQLGLTIQGAIKNSIGKKDHFLPDQTFYAIPPETVHTESMINDDPLHFRFVFLPRQLVECSIEEMDQPGMKNWNFHTLTSPDRLSNATLVSLFSTFYHCLQFPLSEIQLESSLLKLLHCVQTATTGSQLPAVDARRSKEISLITEFIRENFHRKLTLDELSGIAFMSKYHLLRKFHRETGIPIHQYQLQWKIAQAKIWLKEGKSIADTSFDLGFSDTAHFSHTFKRNTAQLPARFK